MKKTMLLTLFFAVQAQAFFNPTGEKAYLRYCSSCHGVDGKSETDIGRAVNARNLITGEYKQVKDRTVGVTEDDIFNTIKTGVPGTAMSPFGHLSEADRRAIAQYVMELRQAAYFESQD